MIHLLCAFYRRCLALRYKLKIKGIKALQGNEPLLILPNHQALVDPQILFSNIYRYKEVSPVMTDSFYSMPVLHYLFKYAGAVPVPVIEKGQKGIDMQSVYGRITEGLQQGKNIILYPSGMLARQGKEVIIGKQSTWAIIESLPENVRIIAARQHGLWGSMWGFAWNGSTPNFITTYLRAIGITLSNLLLLVPKRCITLEFVDITKEAKQQATKGMNEINSFLEETFNVHGEEPITYVPHFFWQKQSQRTPPKRIEGSLSDVTDAQEITEDQINPDVLSVTTEKIAEMLEIDKNSMQLTDNLIIDLNFDSLNLAEIVAILRQEFPHSSNPPLTSLKTIGDLCLMAQGMSTVEAELPDCTFIHDSVETPHQGVSIAEQTTIEPTSTITHHILRTLTTNRSAALCFDAMQGTTTRQQYLTKAVVLSTLITKLTNDDKVGIMLPALQVTSQLITAAYLAGKTPVMLNWTVGEKALRHCMDCTNLQTILTAKSFFDLVKEQIPESLHDRFIFLEDEGKKLSLFTKINGLIKSRLPRSLIHTLCVKKPVSHKASQPQSQLAVILFTSGSESLPKPVPLTHKNILADLQGTLSVFPFSEKETLIGFLPPFHSFGFTVTTILPLLLGTQTAYTPNPTDARAIVQLVSHCQGTVLASTPSFLKMIMSMSNDTDLQSLRLAVTGAEACPQSVRDTFRSKVGEDALIVEGYGITECSPVVTINPPDAPKEGTVGVCINGITPLVRNLESNKPCATNEDGMIYVHGDSIFNGYLDPNIDSPFEEIDGKQYYKTGDLGHLDEDGYLTITGRLKRFIKIAGEMISLPFIEGILLEKYGNDEEVVLAVEGSDQIDPPQIVLFSITEIDTKEANAHLRASGVGNLLQIHQVRLVDEIPLLGTGKVDYKVLKQQISS